MEHGLVKYEYQVNSYEQYRHYCECKCGWQCRVGTEAAAKSQFDNHLEHHQVKAHFKNLPVKDEVGGSSDPNWKPSFNS